MIKTPLSTAIGGVGFYTKNTLVIGGHKPEPQFDITSLFKNGEHGLWLDRNDMSTMYQAAAATVPVLSKAQQVGLMLDKSKELVIGAEKVRYTNVNLSAGATIELDTFVFNSVAANSGFFINNSVQTGRAYKVSLNVDDLIGGLQLMVGRGAGSQVARIDNSGSYEFILFSFGTVPEIRINAASTGATCVIRDLSVKQLAGNHAYQITSSARPLLQDNVQFDGIDDALNIVFPSALINCTIVTVKHGEQAQILENQSIAQNHVINEDFMQYLLINRSLTAQERTQILDYFNKIGATT